MRHIINHMMSLGCLRSVSSEENEMTRKEFKQIYPATNTHIDTIVPQLLASWCNHDIHVDMGDKSDDLDDNFSHFSTTASAPISNL